MQKKCFERFLKKSPDCHKQLSNASDYKYGAQVEMTMTFYDAFMVFL